MIIVFHDRENVLKIFDFEKNLELSYDAPTIQQTIFNIALDNRNRFLGWCNNGLEQYINHVKLKAVFHHKLIMASYATANNHIISSSIGYVEDSTYLNVKYNVTYPTWLMSSDIGGISSEVMLQFNNLSSYKISFDLFLNHLSKQAIKKGLFCYSEPSLLIDGFPNLPIVNQKNLFSFVKNYYRLRWVFILFFNFLIYEKKIKLWSLLSSFLTPKLKKDKIDFCDITVQSSKFNQNLDISYDVLIPTLGRAKALKDVLLDLTKQAILPKKVIIVEQNGLQDSKTELNYIYDQEWPFKIDHTFIHQLGACNARNIALAKITSPWVFFADDDIRITKTLIENVLQFIKQYGLLAVNLAILERDEGFSQKVPIQWHSFGSGCSFIEAKVVKDIRFGLEYELGFGEDSDFGMKIRNKGIDIIYYPNSEIIHLKAASGGFRAKTELLWQNDSIQPKPSPTVLAYRIKHTTKEQLLGYKTILFFKFFKAQNNKNPFLYISKMIKNWNRSNYWASYLINKYKGNEI